MQRRRRRQGTGRWARWAPLQSAIASYTSLLPQPHLYVEALRLLRGAGRLLAVHLHAGGFVERGSVGCSRCGGHRRRSAAVQASRLPPEPLPASARLIGC